MVELITTLLARAGFPGAKVVPTENAAFGEYATNIAFSIAAERGVSPLSVAEEIRATLRARVDSEVFHAIEVAPPGFINFYLSPLSLGREVATILRLGGRYGASRVGVGKSVIVEYPSVNIAKPMHVGHLRTAVIGEALANLHAFLGYRVVRWDYLGDWGTQFGKLIAAYKLWGDEAAVQSDPIGELTKLYVRFHEEMKTSPDLAGRGQEEFRKLETGDRENRALWARFRRESLVAFSRLYRTLGIHTDVSIGESSYERALAPLIERLLARGIARESEGALIVPLDDEKLPPAIVRKSDGSSIYLTRDLANLEYRLTAYRPAKILYVVANQQSLHFSQVFAVAKKLGFSGAELTHVKFGLVLGESGKKFSTREGGAVTAEEVVLRAIELARGIVEEKNPSLASSEKERIAETVGVGALKYNDLSQHRLSDIVFNWEKMLSFEGDSAPYLQYTYARLASILRKASYLDRLFLRVRYVPAASLSDCERNVLRLLGFFPYAARRAAERYEPNVLASHLLSLANAANAFYESEPILKASPKVRLRRLAYTAAVSSVLKTGLRLLGIGVVERM